MTQARGHGSAYHGIQLVFQNGDHGNSVLLVYRGKDIRRLCEELSAEGYEVAPVNLNTGRHPVDHHIDVPPYGFSPYLKLQLENLVITSIGLMVRMLVV